MDILISQKNLSLLVEKELLSDCTSVEYAKVCSKVYKVCKNGLSVCKSVECASVQKCVQLLKRAGKF